MKNQWPASNWPNEYGRLLSNSHDIRQLGAENAVSPSSNEAGQGRLPLIRRLQIVF